MGAQANQVAVSVAEFCKAVRISRSFFYRLCREGRGPVTFKLGRKTLIATSDADAWLSALPKSKQVRVAQGG